MLKILLINLTLIISIQHRLVSVETHAFYLQEKFKLEPYIVNSLFANRDVLFFPFRRLFFPQIVCQLRSAILVKLIIRFLM